MSARYAPLPNPHTDPHAIDEMEAAFDDSDDEDVGPMPLPAGYAVEEKDGVTEFLEKEERRRKQIEVRFLVFCL